MDLFEKTRKFQKKINRTNDYGENEYYLIYDFGKSSVASESGFLYPMFRIFTPAKPEKGRKLNSIYGNSFNPYKDTLMDYATIIQYKLGKVGSADWREYNRLISVHTSLCPINCWHCYLEECLRSECDVCSFDSKCNGKRIKSLQICKKWLSAESVLSAFLKQRDEDKSKGISSNVLRITGGEPFLVPNLILEILQILERRGLSKDIFVWTETNLIPLCVSDEQGYDISDELLNKLGKFKNFCVHPCFHGIDVFDFRDNTGETIDNIETLINGLRRLIQASIDVYPTFGGNVSNPDSINQFYEKISEIDSLLPLRFNIIEYDLDYDPIKRRRENIQNSDQQHKQIYDRFLVIDKWNKQLQKYTKYNYAEIPRHLVPIKKIEEVIKEKEEVIKKKEEVINKEETKKMIKNGELVVHLFKRPAIVEYNQMFLQMISLPFNAAGSIIYRNKYVNNDILEIKDLINDNRGIDAVSWVIDCEGSMFKWAYPVRLLRITQVDEDYSIGQLKFYYIAKEFLSNVHKIETIEDLKRGLSIEFNSSSYSSPCKEKGFVFIGPKFKFQNILLSNKLELDSLSTAIKDISPNNGHKKNEIAGYPLIFVEGVKEKGSDDFLNPNDVGKYELLLEKFYEIDYVFFKSDKFRQLNYCLGDQKLNGRSGHKQWQYGKIQKNDKTLNVPIKGKNDSEDIEFQIQIPIEVKHKLYNDVMYALHNNNVKSMLFFIFIVIIAILIILFINYINANVVWGFITVMIVFLFGKSWDLLYPKTK